MTGSIKPSPPAAPNGGALSAAQSYGDVQTAIGNTIMANANEQNPYGQVQYSQIGSQNIQIPIFNNQGAFQGMQTISIPQFNKATTLTPTGQQLLDQQQQIGTGLNSLALSQEQRLQNVLGQPIDASGLPARTNSYGAAPTFQTVGSGPNLQPVNTTIADAGAALRNIGDVGAAQRSIGDVGAAQRNLGDVGIAFGGFGDVGYANSNLRDAGQIQKSIGPTDYEQARSNVENAIYSRLNPQIERDRNALETKLVNQGLVRGTTAFNNAMDEANRQANDARMQAILAGGQEQSRLAGLDLQKGQFANQAQQQNYDQILGLGNFSNNAILQNYNQALGRAQLANAATAQNFNQGLQSAQFANAGQAQDFGQALQRGQFANAGQEQDFGQALQRGQFSNAGQEQAFGQANQRGLFDLQATQQNNQNLQQQYQDLANAIQANNQSAQQGYQNAQSAAQFGNENRNQALQEQLSLRNQPINEISALLAGGQVQVPQFQNYNPGTIAPNNIAQNIYNSAALANQNYQTQQSGINALLGGLAGLGGAGLYGLTKKYA